MLPRVISGKTRGIQSLVCQGPFNKGLLVVPFLCDYVYMIFSRRVQVVNG